MTPSALRRARILQEIVRERIRQDERWGVQDLPSVPAGFSRLHCVIPSERQAKAICDNADAAGELSHAHITLEEFCESFDARTDEERRGELVQLAACVVKWIEQIDRDALALAKESPECPTLPPIS